MRLNVLIVLFLILIIGLAIIAYQNKVEGYTNTNTVWSNYLQLIEPVVKQINYFQGKQTKLENKNTKRTCEITEIDTDCMYATDYDSTSASIMYSYTGPKISEADATKLLDRLIKPEVVQILISKTDSDIKTEVDSVLAALVTLVTRDVYDTEIPNILKMLQYDNSVNKDKTKQLGSIAFFSRIGDINASKASELYSKAWDSTTTADELQVIIDNLMIADYKQKLEIMKQLDYFKTKITPPSNVPELSESKVAQIYDKLYKDHTTAGLAKIFVDLAIAIDDYDNKVKAIPVVATKPSEPAYNPNIPDVTYHESAEDIRAKDTTVTVSIRDASGNIINSLPWDKAVTTTPRYNDSSYFRYNPSPYVPSYEDSVYLSRTTNYNDNTQFVDHGLGLPASKGGFCEANKKNVNELETQCGKVGTDACASMSCCVLLGGSKCVAGNEAGPSMKSNYSDISVLNRDYYYYQGKCYGNCPG